MVLSFGRSAKSSNNVDINDMKSNDIENNSNDHVKNKENKKKSTSLDFDPELVSNYLAERSSAESQLKISLYDFGGQKIFSSIHHLFLTKFGVYVIVFNMEWMVGDEEEKNRCFEYLDFWVNSVAIHTCDEKSVSAPIAFVGTHADCVSSEDDYKVISKEIKDNFGTVWASIIEYDDFQGTSESLSFFPVNNKKGQVDENLQKLLQHVEKEILRADYIQEKYPLRWLKCMDTLKALSAEKPYLTMSEIKTHCCGSSLIEDEENELPIFLQFAHEMGAIMWHYQDKALKDIVILDPVKFLIKPATYVICQYGKEGDNIRHRQEVRKKCEKQLPKAWNQMMQRGIVSSELLALLLDDFAETRETIILLMVKYGLMMPIEKKSSSKHFLDKNVNARYSSDMVVPSLLPVQNVSSISDLFQVPGKWPATCFFSFQANHMFDPELEMVSSQELTKDGFLPYGLFEHLVSKMLRYVNHQVPHKNKYDGLFQDTMICFLSRQLVRLSNRKDMNSIAMEVDGNSPVLIYHRVLGLILEIIAEKMHSLKCIPLLQYDDDVFIHLNYVYYIADKGGELKLGRNRILNKKWIREKYEAWVRERYSEIFDLFISYRWRSNDSKGDDSSLTSILFDQLSNLQSIGDDDRCLSVFLDHIILQDGEQFQEKFCECLFNARVFLPVVSSDALMRMFEGKFTSDQEDNVLIEWMLAMRVAKVKGAKIFPLLIGNLIADDADNNGSLGYLQKRESFFSSKLLDKLSTLIPTKCIEIANKVMQYYQFPSSPIPEQSVKDIVCELTKYQAYDFCKVDSKEVVEDYTEKVMEVLRKKISEDEKATKIPQQKVSVEKSTEGLVQEDKIIS